MVSYTRDMLIKGIVAKEMIDCTGEDYHKHLKELYHKWEHESSETLCKKYNELDVSYTNLRAHETGRKPVCRLLLEKKKKYNS